MPGRHKTILIVDDDDSFRTVLRLALQDEYEVLEAAHPREGLALALQRNPDCILVDLELPGVSGVELCTILSDLNATSLIPIIVITGHPAARLEEISQAVRIAGYMEKPFDMAELKVRVAAAAGTRRGDRRREGRVRLPIPLRIAGTDNNGASFDTELVTHDVSSHGFSSSTALSLPIGSSIQAWMTTGKQTARGEALVVRVERPGTAAQRYGFQFISKPVNWILR